MGPGSLPGVKLALNWRDGNSGEKRRSPRDVAWSKKVLLSFHTEKFEGLLPAGCHPWRQADRLQAPNAGGGGVIDQQCACHFEQTPAETRFGSSKPFSHPPRQISPNPFPGF